MTASFQTFSFDRRPARKPTVKCGKVDLNNLEAVRELIFALTHLLTDLAAWHKLEVNGAYFVTPEGRLPTEPGWYVICNEQRTALYVGESSDLNSRLNSEDGSRDGFLNPQRTSDPERNLIKALRTMEYISGLSVGVIRESDLLRAINLIGPLEKKERIDVEKMLNLFRHIIVEGILV